MITTTTPLTAREVADRLIGVCQHSTAEELTNRLDLMTYLFFVVEQALKIRFPAEYHEWLAARGEIEEEE